MTLQECSGGKHRSFLLGITVDDFLVTPIDLVTGSKSGFVQGSFTLGDVPQLLLHVLQSLVLVCQSLLGFADFGIKSISCTVGCGNLRLQGRPFLLRFHQSHASFSERARSALYVLLPPVRMRLLYSTTLSISCFAFHNCVSVFAFKLLISSVL